MTRRAMGLDVQLAARLKQVRDAQPQQDPARLRKMRGTLLKKAQRRWLVRTTGATMIATTIALGAFTLPARFVSGEQVYRPPHRVASNTYPVSADPWVIASADRTGIQGDGWVPRRWSP